MPLQSANIVVTREGVGNDTSVEDYAYEQSGMMQGEVDGYEILDERSTTVQSSCCLLTHLVKA
ncbi:MAG: hypothetical protein H0T92_21950 [Pyrinomonadaceae bacterium]|nr:hypothetical protein [Pyrinomonadaceae bacterium]